MKQRLLEGKRLEYCALALFATAYVVISTFHEPWFDEAQAWQIAKCANLKEILFEIPHYEGHPPFWHLILAIPSKAGVPFEIGLKLIGLLVAVFSAWLILFKMPYPRLMRLLMPFSYFVFYQYGIIVRPYGLMMLSLLLLARAFPQRESHPWRFSLLLMLLCLTSAYGIILAGAIAICLVWELLREKGIKTFAKEVFKDQKTISLSALLLVAILLILGLLPRNDTWVTSAGRTNSFWICLLCAVFTFIGECTLTTSSWFNLDRILLQNSTIPKVEMGVFCIIGIFVWLLIIGASSRKLLKYFLVPYGLLAVFAAAVYFSVHHIGIVLMLMLFWTGILFQDSERFEIGRAIVGYIAKTPHDRFLLKKTALFTCIAGLIIPLYWNVLACVIETQVDYSYGRTGAKFLIEHSLTDKKILSSWGESEFRVYNRDNNCYLNIYEVGNPVVLNAYFNHNLCYNLNGGRNNEAYMHYKLASDAEVRTAIEQWRETGFPEVIIGQPKFERIFGDDFNFKDYTLVHLLELNYIWKNSTADGKIPIYVRNDLLAECRLEPYEDELFRYWNEGIPITEEMMDQIRNGVPAEEVLKPYLDIMFGPEK